MKKANLAFVISSLNPGGAERVLSILANELISDFNITIITLYKCKPFYALHDEVRLEYCQENSIENPTKWQSVLNHFRLFSNLRKHLKTNHIDICIGFMTTSNIYVSLASKLKGINCIISARNHPKYSDTTRFWSIVRKATYPLANKLVVQTESIKEYFETFMNREQLEIIKNPLATELTVKRNLESPKQKTILNVGRLDDQKNQDLLIRAFSNIDHDGWTLNIIGEGVNRSKYEALIESLNLKSKVILLGNKSNVDYYYNQSSIFVFSSRYEGFPNALTEAMFFGLPCISTDCPSGPSELIQDGHNGFLIAVEDQKALEIRLKELMDNESLRKTFSENAINNTESFKPETIANEWKSLIEQLLD